MTRSLGRAALVFVAVITVVFLLVEGIGGDGLTFSDEVDAAAAHAIRARHGLDRPLLTRYADLWLGLFGLGDAVSLRDGRAATAHVATALPSTLRLVGLSLLLSWPFGVWIGRFQAAHAGEPLDRVTTTSLVAVHALPGMVLGILLQAIAPTFGLPLSGTGAAWGMEAAGPVDRLVDSLRHLVLPVTALVLLATPPIARLARATALDALADPLFRTMRARGLPERRVQRHLLRHLLLPLLPVLGLTIGRLVGGAVVIEAVFGWPGMGTLLATAATSQDLPVLALGSAVVAVAAIVGNAAADSMHAALDPRLHR